MSNEVIGQCRRCHEMLHGKEAIKTHRCKVVVKGVMTPRTARKIALQFLSQQLSVVGEAKITELDDKYVVTPVLGPPKEFPFAE